MYENSVLNSVAENFCNIQEHIVSTHVRLQMVFKEVASVHLRAEFGIYI